MIELGGELAKALQVLVKDFHECKLIAFNIPFQKFAVDILSLYNHEENKGNALIKKILKEY
ncbi:MAG: hypothetical protein R2883_03955 [Caldisericia bacterium]